MPDVPNAHQRILRRPRVDRPPVVHLNAAPDITIDAGLGRLYVSGRNQQVVSAIGGAAYNERRDAHEVSLTLKSLRAIRAALRMSKEEFARVCSSTVLTWGRRAAQIERAIVDLHARVDQGWRLDLPWRDEHASDDASYREPFDHQRVMASVACSLDGSAFICGVGTGKTRAALESLQHKVRVNEVEIAFVVAPNRVIKVWKDQTPIWAPSLRCVPLTMPIAERRSFVRQNLSRGTMFVVNYETFAALAPLIIELSRTYKIGFIADEMQKFKNPNAQRTKAALKVAAVCVWRLGLTGSPVLQGAQDVWAQWYIVDLGTEFGASNVQFRREFFVTNEYTNVLYPRRGTLDELGVRMRKRGVRYATEDCLDLPPVIDLDPFEVTMTREQMRAYVEMEDQLITRMDSGELATAATQLVSYLRLMQITSGHVTTENGEIHFFDPNPKLDMLEEVVRDNINAEQIIVWAHFRPDMDMLIRRFHDLNPVVVRGGMSLVATDRAENMFQDGSARLLLGQPGAGGLGLNLQAASLALYYSMSYSLEDWIQSRGRCHRAGSEIHARVAYGTFRCRGTIDDIVFGSLTRKDTVQDIVVNLRNHIRQRLLT